VSAAASDQLCDKYHTQLTAVIMSTKHNKMKTQHNKHKKILVNTK